MTGIRKQALHALNEAKIALHNLEREFWGKDSHPAILSDHANEVERWTAHFKGWMSAEQNGS